MKLSEEIEVDDERDVVTICGIRYAGQFFRAFGRDLNSGDTFRFHKRQDGVVVIGTEEKKGGQA